MSSHTLFWNGPWVLIVGWLCPLCPNPSIVMDNYELRDHVMSRHDMEGTNVDRCVAKAKFIDGELGEEEEEDSNSEHGQVDVDDTQNDAGEEDLEEGSVGEEDQNDYQEDDQDQVDEEEDDVACDTSGDDIRSRPSYGGKQPGMSATPDITGLDDDEYDAGVSIPGNYNNADAADEDEDEDDGYRDRAGDSESEESSRPSKRRKTAGSSVSTRTTTYNPAPSNSGQQSSSNMAPNAPAQNPTTTTNRGRRKRRGPTLTGIMPPGSAAFPYVRCSKCTDPTKECQFIDFEGSCSMCQKHGRTCEINGFSVSGDVWQEYILINTLTSDAWVHPVYNQPVPSPRKGRKSRKGE